MDPINLDITRSERLAVSVPQNAQPNAEKTAARPFIPETAQTQQAQLTTDEILAGLLKSYGMRPTEENLAILALLGENKMPLTKEAILQMNRALKLTGSAEQALFLLAEGIPLTKANAGMLKALTDGQAKLADRLTAVADTLAVMAAGELTAEGLENTGLTERLIALFTEGESSETYETQGAQAARLTPEQAATEENAARLVTAMADEAVDTPDNTTAKREARPTPEQPPAAPKAERSSGEQPHETSVETAIYEEGETSAKTARDNAQSARSEATAPRASDSEGNQAITTTQTAKSQPSQALHTNTRETEPRRVLSAGSEKAAPPPERADNAEIPVRRAASRLQKALTVNLSGMSLKDLDDFFKDIRAKLVQAGKLTAEASHGKERGSLTQKLASELETAREHLDFADRVNSRVFAQIPVQVNEKAASAELFVFKDKRKKTAKSGGAASALIALDTANLDRFEVYVQKRGNSVDCRFRLKDDRAGELVKAKIGELQDMLALHGYDMNGWGVSPIDEPYKVTDREPSEVSDDNVAKPAASLILDVKA